MTLTAGSMDAWGWQVNKRSDADLSDGCWYHDNILHKNILYSCCLFTFIGFETKPQHKLHKIDPSPFYLLFILQGKMIQQVHPRERPYCRQIIIHVYSFLLWVYTVSSTNCRSRVIHETDRDTNFLYSIYCYWFYIGNGRSIDITKDETHPSILHIQWKETQVY
jgi:hypothetical protein